MDVRDIIIEADCLSGTCDMPEGSVDLIVTSPPYAMRRKSTYGGIPEKDYPAWLCERANEFERVLSIRGSFILNIKEHCNDGERSDYVMRTVLALRDIGWRLVDEFIWHKKNAMPGHWPTRLKDGWEHLFHFAHPATKVSREINFYPDAVRQPISGWTAQRAKHGRSPGRKASKTGSGFGANQEAYEEKVRKELSATGSGFTKNREAEKTWTTARPSNVLHCACELTNKGHPAVFPAAIPEFFIKLMTKPGDTVLDPFCGSGTTCEVAKRLGRHYVGVDICEEYCELAIKRLANV